VEYEDIEEWDVGSTADSLAKCKAVKEGFEDIWCQRQCGKDRSLASCPKEDCVCDWSGDWPDDDKDGFASWSLESLGIEEHKSAQDHDEAEATMTPADVLAICAKPVS